MRSRCVLAAVITACASPPSSTKTQPKALDDTPREPVTLTGAVRPAPPDSPTKVSQTPIVIAVDDPGGGAVHEDPVCSPHWETLPHDDIDRCAAGDPASCVDIGDVYVAGCDAFSSIKWYRRACGLGSGGACATLDRLGDSRTL